MSFKKNVIAFFIIGILGVTGHFVYEWSGENYAIGLFFPVNESTWEHLKLLFFPTVIYSAFEYFLSNEKPSNYLQSVVFSTICGMLWIIILFYTIKGVFGKSPDFINISIYFISIIIMLCKKTKLIKREKFELPLFHWLALIAGILVSTSFIFYSYNPPSINLFMPPVA
ncbi:MAG: hypothetical protein IKT93_01835 [Clostridia bacterium]|nr:hypothetical protein [Clostridia bacterium]